MEECFGAKRRGFHRLGPRPYANYSLPNWGAGEGQIIYIWEALYYISPQ